MRMGGIYIEDVDELELRRYPLITLQRVFIYTLFAKVNNNSMRKSLGH